MKSWFEQRKPAMIMMGIVYVILALFFVSAYVNNKVIYLTKLQMEASSGDKIDENGEPIEEKKDSNVKVDLSEDGRGMFPILFDMFQTNIKDVGNNLLVIFQYPGDYFDSLKMFSLVYFVIFIVLMLMIKTEKEFAGVEHGSAGWAENGEEYEVLSRTEGFILAKDHFMPMIPNPPPGKNGNILVIGGSGSGKSASFAIPNAMQMLGSYCFTDPKGELYDRTAGLLKKHGYHVHVINLADPKYSDGYNPLAHIRNTMDVDIITKIISQKDNKGGNKGGDPFWDQTSEALLKAMIYYILFNRPKEEHSLASCAALVRYGAENEGEDLMEIFKSLPFDNPARRQFDNIRLGSEKTFANILVSLAAKLSAFDSEDIAALTACNSFEFEDLAKEKSVVYFITPESHGTYDFIMNIFFSQMFQRLYEFGDQNNGALPVPMFLILDEFANIGRIPNFERILSTCRSKKLHISIILQSLDQIEEIYDEKMAQIIMANCSTQLFLGSNAQKTLETFSKLLGEKTISHDSTSRSTDKDNSTSGHSYSDQIMARALMTPDELRRLDTDDCLIFIQAMKPIKTRKYWYYNKKINGRRPRGIGGPHPRYDEAVACEISHLTEGNQVRGNFEISNPTEWNSRSSEPNFDDLWNMTPKTPTPDKKQIDPFEDIIDEFGESQIANKANERTLNNYSNSQSGAEKSQVSEDNYDLQAELEKRFDELFGPTRPKGRANYMD